MAEDFPVAQRDGILTESIDGELVVVDSRTQQAHALPALAATVWSLCDGNHGVAAIAARTGFSPDQVTDVLAQLRERDLLETAGTDHAIDRRAMLSRTAKLGGAAALTAPILTVALPAAAHASSTSTTSTFYISYDGNYMGSAYGYYVSPPDNGSVQAAYNGGSFPAYAELNSPASSSAPSGGKPYVQIAVKSDGSLELTLSQYNGAGSATYTAPDGATYVLSGSNPMANAYFFNSSSATLIVSATQPSNTPATYYISYDSDYTGSSYGYYVSPPDNGSVQAAYNGGSYPAYADLYSASSSAPSGDPYVQIAVKSDGSLELTLFQFNGAGSATYTAPDGTAYELTGSSPTADSYYFTSGSATLVVSAT